MGISAFADAFAGFDENDGGEPRVKTALMFSPAEMLAMGELLSTAVKGDVQTWQTLLKEEEKILKIENEEKRGTTRRAFNKKRASAGKPLIKVIRKIKNLKPKDRADIVLMGRMVASDPTLTIEGAAMFSHAISTHKVTTDIDYFSAVDDSAPEGEFGAAITGHLEFNSAVYYRYIGLDVDLERKTSGFTDAELRDVTDTFIRSAAEVAPTARKNSFAGHTRPSYILATVRKGQPLSLVNAFDVPVTAKNGSGLIRPSIEALEAHRRREQTWSKKDNAAFEKIFSTIEPYYDPDITPDSFCEAVLNHLFPRK
jgi:CRISPR system Cascade subunit CasC